MTDTPAPRRLTYRPAIDGLRAFAVLAVLCFHLLPGVLPGGWFGVDVFFVISGFLITALLLSEYRQRRGRIDLLHFWRARARRLLPALVLVLAATLAMAPFLTAAGRVRSVAGDVLATLFYVANWRFVVGDEAYFGQIASPSPLRHAWSLGVEEQFYILYPLLLIGLLALTRRRTTLVAILVGLSTASAVLMAHLHEGGLDPSRVYYGTDTRAHQLLVGAAVAALVTGGPGTLGPDRVGVIDRWCRRLALPALLVVLSAFWWAGPHQGLVLEGLAVPLSVLICVVLVAATSPVGSPVQRALSWEPLRRTGVVSYGLYLWHWPIIVFLNDQVLPVPTAARIAIQVGLTALLSWASHRFVEQPVRRGGLRALVPRLPRSSLVIGWATVPALTVGALTMPVAARTLPETVGGTTSDEVTVPEQDYRPKDRMTSVALLGNSIPQGLYTDFRSANHPDLTLINATNVGCDPLDAPRYSEGAALPEGEDCQEWRDGWARQFTREKPDVVLYFVPQTMVSDRLVGERDVPFGSDEWVSLVEEGLATARESAGSAEFAVVNLACHDMPSFDSEEVSRINDTEYVTDVNDTVQAWADREDVPVLDQYSLLCSGDRAHDTINDVPLYKDGIHFTPESARVLWRWLAPRLQEISTGVGRS